MRNPAQFCVFALALALSTAASAQQPVQPLPAAIPPVPPALLAAKSVFVSNAGGDSGLFPTPFSGDTNRAYAEFYGTLQSSGAFQLVSDPAEADLVLELRLFAPYGPTNPNKQNGAADPRPMFRLAVYDRKSHYLLWTVTQSVEIAFLQKTHDRNFDLALTEVLNQFLAVAGKPAVR